MQKKKTTIAIAGLGNRGKDAYAVAIKSFPQEMEIVAIADIVPEKVAYVAKEYNVPQEMCFTSAEEMLKEEKLADVMFIATLDKQHVAQAIPALQKGYDLLLEKPISPYIEECKEILKVSKQTGRKVVVCHVLRYTPFFNKVKQIISSGTIGDVVSIMAIENVGYWHQAHSFVRGNWNKSETTSPMFLQKCCHDMDLYLWLCNKHCKSVSSYGSLSYFKPANAPAGAAKRCLDGCKVKEDCPFDAEKIYITDEKTGIAKGNMHWPVEVLCLNPTLENVNAELENGPYGRCVYHCDNNVVDHQVVNLEMTDSSTMSFTMCAFTADNSRYAKIMGTKGELVTNMQKNSIEVAVFGKALETININLLSEDFTGHGGGDLRLVEDFILYVQDDKNTNFERITSLEHSMESHYIALAAEESRLAGGEKISI